MQLLELKNIIKLKQLIAISYIDTAYLKRHKMLAHAIPVILLDAQMSKAEDIFSTKRK